MPVYEHGRTSIYYEQIGTGFPLLLLAPGGLSSTIERWELAEVNPLTDYAGDFKLIAMDQRNAGRSSGPLVTDDPWGAYAEDHFGLLDHLGIDRFLVMGCCIGCSYALRLAELAPARVVAAVLEQPIGITDDNREGWVERYRDWAAKLASTRDDFTESDSEAFGSAMFHGDFVGSVTRDAVSALTTPFCVLPGTDRIHPREIGLEVANLAKNVDMVDPWKEGSDNVANAIAKVRIFLGDHAASS